MPNWCQTRIRITCRSTPEAEDLLSKIEDWTSSSKATNGFGSSWLGNIVIGAGIGTIPENKKTDVECRGWLEDAFTQGNTLEVWTETAWTPKVRMWKLVADKYAPGAVIIYDAIEDGCNVHWTNDPQLEGLYYVVDDIECRDMKKDDLLKYLQKVLSTDESDINKLISDFNDSDSVWGFIKEWVFIPLSQLCEEEEQNVLASSGV